MLLFRRRRMPKRNMEKHTNSKDKDKTIYEEKKEAVCQPEKPGSPGKVIPCETNWSDAMNHSFAMNISECTGQTVTIFVAGGGPSGAGFTGIILKVNGYFVRLLIRMGSPPGYALRNSCPGTSSPYNSRYIYRSRCRCFIPSTYNNSLATGRYTIPLGAVADIPINKITSFVHNVV